MYLKKPENIIYNLKKSGKKYKEKTKKTNEVQTELSLQTRAHFANQVFQKCTEHDASFLTLWSGNRALATVLFTFCQQLLQIEARTNGNRDPTYFGPGSHISEKSQGFAPKRVLTNSGVSELLLCSCYVVDCPWAFVRDSEVFELNFLWIYSHMEIYYPHLHPYEKKVICICQNE